MYRKRFDGMDCSIARALDEVGEWWTLLIVRECTQGSRRFDEFQSGLGIARNVLTARLERLIELDILERFPVAERANTFGYRLTSKGADLYPVLVALMQWGDKWLRPNGKPPITLVEHASGESRGDRGSSCDGRASADVPGRAVRCRSGRNEGDAGRHREPE